MAYRVLVVDDEPAVREILEAMLEMQGHEVTIVGLVSEALTQLRRHPFDLVLLDVNIPGGSGWEVLDVIQASRPRPPVLMISDERYQDEALRRGAAGFLAKPYHRRAVDNAVSQILGAHFMPAGIEAERSGSQRRPG